MDNVKTRILSLVKVRPAVLQNPNDLVTAYWIIFDKVTQLSDIPKATKAETIMREFRGLADAGMITVQRPRRDKSVKARVFTSEFDGLT